MLTTVLIFMKYLEEYIDDIYGTLLLQDHGGVGSFKLNIIYF